MARRVERKEAAAEIIRATRQMHATHRANHDMKASIRSTHLFVLAKHNDEHPIIFVSSYVVIATVLA